MIVYNVLDEIRIILYLISFGIFIVTGCDIVTTITKEKQKLFWLLQTLYAVTTIVITYFFSFRLKEGYISQYGLPIIIIGIGIYFLLIRKSFVKIIQKIRIIISKTWTLVKKIFKPLKVFKTTFLLVKKKIKKLNIKMLYKKKKL